LVAMTSSGRFRGVKRKEINICKWRNYREKRKENAPKYPPPPTFLSFLFKIKFRLGEKNKK
jgi:hypothetical protein